MAVVVIKDAKVTHTSNGASVQCSVDIAKKARNFFKLNVPDGPPDAFVKRLNSAIRFAIQKSLKNGCTLKEYETDIAYAINDLGRSYFRDLSRYGVGSQETKAVFASIWNMAFDKAAPSWDTMEFSNLPSALENAPYPVAQ